MERQQFRLHFPGGRDRCDHLDFAALQKAGAIRHWRDSDGVLCLGFAAPYTDLTVRDGEILTLEKAAALSAAMRYFGATKEHE